MRMRKNDINMKNQKIKRLMVIDALNMFFRCYIVNPTISKEGHPIGGTAGFLKSLQKLCREINPDSVILCWDGRGGSRKRKLKNKNYKEGRSPVRLNRDIRILGEQEEKENKIWQMHRIVEYLNNFPVIQLVAEEVEADDIIAYMCKSPLYEDWNKVIVSSDKDFYQLLDDSTVLYRPIQNVFLNRPSIIEGYGIHPNNFALARAIVGDKSDNLEGVPGIGLKTVSKRFPFFKEKKDVLIPELIEFSENQDNKVKAYSAVCENEKLIKENYDLMQLYNPSISVQTKNKIKWTVKEFDYSFNKTDTSVMMLNDGIFENNWGDLFSFFRRLCRDAK